MNVADKMEERLRMLVRSELLDLLMDVMHTDQRVWSHGSREDNLMQWAIKEREAVEARLNGEARR